MSEKISLDSSGQIGQSGIEILIDRLCFEKCCLEGKNRSEYDFK